jgi:hypothetical protein
LQTSANFFTGEEQKKRMNDERKAISLAQANAVVDRIQANRAQLVANRMQLAGKLEALESAAGARYLDGDRTALKEIADLSGELQLIERALTVLEQREVVAARDVRIATAADLRRQVAEKESEVAAIDKRTEKLLGQLSEIEAVSYTRCILGYERKGDWYTTRGGLAKAEPWHGPGEVFPEPVNHDSYHVPRSRILRKEIEEMSSRALAIEEEIFGPQAIAVPPHVTFEPSGKSCWEELDHPPRPEIATDGPSGGGWSPLP